MAVKKEDGLAEKVEAVPLTEEDQDKLDQLIDAQIDKEAREKVRAILKPGGIRKIMGDHQGHLRSVEDALLIIDKWSPRNDNTTKKFDKDGNTVGLKQGDYNSINEVELDAMYLASLNAKIATVWSVSKGAVGRAKSHLEAVKAEAKKAVSEAKRAGFLKDKIKTVDQVESLARTTKSVKEAEEDLLAVTEQMEILGGCYFATKDAMEVLLHRSRGLRSEQRHAGVQPG